MAQTGGEPPRSVADVVNRMQELEDRLPAVDGVRWFNHLYLEVTRAVAGALTASSFHDPAFMQRLDVVFAGLYLSAVEADARGDAALPSAWAPLFQSRANREIAPWQFALCGMNAHINHDLPIAVVATYGELGGPDAATGPRDGTDRARDYGSVNDLLGAIEARVKREYETGLAGVLDRVFPRVEDHVAQWSVASARAGAWSTARALWSLRSDAPARAAYLDALDHLVGFAGRGLLIAV